MSTTHQAQTVGPRGALGFLADRSVRTKILSGVIAACLGMTVITWVAISGLSSLHAGQERMQAEAVVPLTKFDEVRRAYLQTRVDALADEFVADTNGVEHTAYLADVQATHKAVDALAKAVKSDKGLSALVTKLDTAWAAYDKVVSSDEFLQLARSGNKKAYIAMRDAQVKPQAVTIQESLDQLTQHIGLNTRQALAAAQSDYSSARRTLLLVAVLAALVALALATVATRAVTRPLRQVSEALEAVAEGDLTKRVTVSGHDEVGAMAESLNTATESMAQTVQAIAGGVHSLDSSAHELSDVATQVSASAEETASQANVVAAAAEQVSRSVETVATGSEEMDASIKEIAQNASEAAAVASQAVAVAEATNATVSKLGESSLEIGNVVKVITSIAEQTNLLALNATIEAARAGDAGKGFAVVANEVKDLAQETAKATEDIARRVDAIQADTTHAVQAIGEISEIIGRINDFQLIIASAVEEQTATTTEMNRSVTEASTGVSEIATNIAGVAEASQDTTVSISNTTQASQMLARLSNELQEQVGKFVVSAAAAQA
ncbi:MAG TPA: methyl-accepting chemotaxis protein [Marmoricola sp.]|nr:methyl-accepting chemotaxis protein [Marmoricola sp.]